MVNGFESFKEWFADYEEEFVIIGGVACDLIMKSEGQNFRVTKDVDVVLIIEAVTTSFVNRFWNYIKTAGYEHRNKSTGEMQFYRFSRPMDDDFPFMIELFSRKPDKVFIEDDSALTPLPMDEEVSSLSAILLDDDYYYFLREGKVVTDGIPILELKHLVPFKAKAFLDNMMKRSSGAHVDSRDIKKHKNDVFRLTLMFRDDDEPFELPETIRNDMKIFLDVMADESLDVKSLGAGRVTKEMLLDKLRKAYGL